MLPLILMPVLCAGAAYGVGFFLLKEVKKELACVGKLKVGNGKAYVGSRGGTARWVLGSLDEIKVYNRALSAAEIKKDMENPTAVSPAGKLTTSWADVRSNL